MPRLIVKPAINFLSTDKDADLLGNVGGIIHFMTDNESFLDPSPSLAVIDAARTLFQKAVGDAMNGGKLQTVRKYERRSELVLLVRRLASYVAGACNGDLTKLISSGFPIHKPSRHAIGYLSAPEAPVLKQGANSGILIGRVKRPYGAKICSWVLALSTSPDVAVQTMMTTGGRAKFKDLIPGQTYVVKANVISTAGPSNWSSSGRRMVI